MCSQESTIQECKRRRAELIQAPPTEPRGGGVPHQEGGAAPSFNLQGDLHGLRPPAAGRGSWKGRPEQGICRMVRGQAQCERHDHGVRGHQKSGPAPPPWTGGNLGAPFSYL